VSTEKGLPPEYMIPLNLTDVIIANYYMADVAEIS
jgi:hypothetical protein